MDVQFIMKRWWAKELKSEVDNNNQMSSHQYARKEATTMDNLWSRQLSFDYHRSTGIPFCHVDFDARNFYDTVIPEVASLASIRMGMHPKNAKWLIHMLQSFRHRLII